MDVSLGNFESRGLSNSSDGDERLRCKVCDFNGVFALALAYFSPAECL